MNDKNKILILVPGPNARGGITGYYQTLIKYFTLPVEYFERGSREWPNRKNIFSVFIRILQDIWLFYKKLRSKEYSLVQTTTSFSRNSILRDAIFILIAKRFNVKVIIFFHGWDLDYAKKIETKYLKLFKYVYFDTNAIIDLSHTFIDIIIRWGYTQPVFFETTVVDAELISGIDLDWLKKKNSLESQIISLLFLSRIENTKGIYITINAYAILKKKYPDLKLIIAGDGKEESAVKEYISRMDLKDIIFTGHVQGFNKKELFMESHIYILPSFYTEGMPTTVLEAMAFGLPVITRPVGGIPDIFRNGENGFYDESKDPMVFAKLIENLIIDKTLLKKIAFNNFNYAQDRFISHLVVARVEEIFLKVLNK